MGQKLDSSPQTSFSRKNSTGPRRALFFGGSPSLPLDVELVDDDPAVGVPDSPPPVLDAVVPLAAELGASGPDEPLAVLPVQASIAVSGLHQIDHSLIGFGIVNLIKLHWLATGRARHFFSESVGSTYFWEVSRDHTHTHYIPTETTQMEPPPRKRPRREPSVYSVLFVDDGDPPQANGESSHKFKILKKEIIRLSVGDAWLEAKEEWRLHRIFYAQYGTCLCTHRPITQHCVIRNAKNGNTTIVGNVCIKQFKSEYLDVEDACWACLARLREDPAGTKATALLLAMAREQKILRPKEVERYLLFSNGKRSRVRYNPDHPCFRKRAYETRERINKRILLGFHGDRPQCNCHPPLQALPQWSRNTQRFFYGCFNYPNGCGFVAPSPQATQCQ